MDKNRFQILTRELNFYELRYQLRSSKGGWFTTTAVTLSEMKKECIKRDLPTKIIYVKPTPIIKNRWF